MISRHSYLRASMFMAVVLSPAVLLAQYQVNRQVNRGGDAGGASSAARFNNALGYGNTAGQYSSGVLLPSQVRAATWAAGATPSANRLTAATVGPLAPTGNSAYVASAPRFTGGMTTGGNYVDRGGAQVPTGQFTWSSLQTSSIASPFSSFAAPGSPLPQATPFSAIGPIPTSFSTAFPSAPASIPVTPLPVAAPAASAAPLPVPAASAAPSQAPAPAAAPAAMP